MGKLTVPAHTVSVEEFIACLDDAIDRHYAEKNKNH